MTPKLAKYCKVTPKVDPDLKLLNDLIAEHKANRHVMPYSARQEAHASQSWLEHKKLYGVDTERVKNKPIKIRLCKGSNRQVPDYALSREEFDRLKIQERKSQHHSPGTPYEELSCLERDGASYAQRLFEA